MCSVFMTRADLFNNEDIAVLRSMVFPFTSETDWIYEIFNPLHKKLRTHDEKGVQLSC